jgi:hypothetical protein
VVRIDGGLAESKAVLLHPSSYLLASANRVSVLGQHFWTSSPASTAPPRQGGQDGTGSVRAWKGRATEKKVTD